MPAIYRSGAPPGTTGRTYGGAGIPLGGGIGYLLAAETTSPFEVDAVETNGPFGTLWAGLGLSAFYIALIWINTLLGIFLTPLFIIPGTWLMDKMGVRKRDGASDPAATANRPAPRPAP
jgi:hypothetical protein